MLSQAILVVLCLWWFCRVVPGRGFLLLTTLGGAFSCVLENRFSSSVVCKTSFLCEKGAYCELVSSLSSLDTASEREPAIRRVFLRARQYSAYPGACGYIRGSSSGHNPRDTDFSVRYLRRAAVVVVVVLVRCHCRGRIVRFLRAHPRAQNRVGVPRRTQAEADA